MGRSSTLEGLDSRHRTLKHKVKLKELETRTAKHCCIAHLGPEPLPGPVNPDVGGAHAVALRQGEVLVQNGLLEHGVGRGLGHLEKLSRCLHGAQNVQDLNCHTVSSIIYEFVRLMFVIVYVFFLAADSSSSSPNVVCLLSVCCCHQVEKLLPNCYLTAT